LNGIATLVTGRHLGSLLSAVLPILVIKQFQRIFLQQFYYYLLHGGITPLPWLKSTLAYLDIFAM